MRKSPTDPLQKNEVALFWHHEEGDRPVKIQPMYQIAAIKRLMWRGGRSPFVIIECSLATTEWLEQLEEGYLEVRYPIKEGAAILDNPFWGTQVCTIKNIRPVSMWVNDLSTLVYNADQMSMHLMAECDIEWTLFDIPPLHNPFHQGEADEGR